MNKNASDQQIEELLNRGVNEVIDYEYLKGKLLSKKKLRVKLGIDPTSPNIHLGRAVVLLKLRDFQQLGHKIVFIVGDFTGVIGDTSDKESERPMLSEKEVKTNMKSYIEQAAKLLDIKKVEVRHNSEWLAKLGYGDIGRQADLFSLAEFSSRENIKKRLNSGSRVSLRELLYPLMQGYDSVMVKADVEIGGTDQRFNLLAGRKLQSYYKQPSQDILTNNLILGTDGRKMSSSWKNTINLFDEPNDMFGKVMSIPDQLIISYFVSCTRVPMPKIAEIEAQLKKGANPRDWKMILAGEITKIYWGEKKAEQARQNFVSVFQKGNIPSEMPELKMAGKSVLEILVAGKLVSSKSEARRLIEQNGVKIDEKTVKSLDEKVKSGSVLQKGKRNFIKII